MADLSHNSLSVGQRPALVLVDLSLGFTDPASPLGCECSEVIDANAQLLWAFRKLDLPIFFSSVVYHSDSEASVFREKVPALNILKAGSHWVDIDPRVKPLDNEVLIEKHWASAFFGTNLKTQLLDARADSLVVTGLTTSGCVRATAVDGLQHNFPVCVVKDAVADRNPAAHDANLFDMQAKYNEVTTLSKVLTSLATLREQKI